jgi:hypothetical protein
LSLRCHVTPGRDAGDGDGWQSISQTCGTNNDLVGLSTSRSESSSATSQKLRQNQKYHHTA